MSTKFKILPTIVKEYEVEVLNNGVIKDQELYIESTITKDFEIEIVNIPTDNIVKDVQLYIQPTVIKDFEIEVTPVLADLISYIKDFIIYVEEEDDKNPHSSIRLPNSQDIPLYIKVR